MTPVPLHLPLRASEAANIADILFQQANGKRLTDDVRGRFAGRLQTLELNSIKVYPGSLQADPTFPSTWYLAVDGEQQGVVSPLLLRIGSSGSPGTGLYPKSLLIGRLRAGGMTEVVISAIPFGPEHHDNIRTFAEKVDKAFLPRPQGATAAHTLVVADKIHHFSSLSSLFQGFPDTGRPGACLELPLGHFWTGVWAAIRAGWRDGYSLALALGENPITEVEQGPYFTRYSLPAGPDIGIIIDHVRRVKAGLPSGYPRTADFEVHATEEDLKALKADGRMVQFCFSSSPEQNEAIRACGVVPTASAPDPGGRVNLRQVA